MRIRPIFAWYDFWIGIYWDRRLRRLYVFPVPCFGFFIQFQLKRWIARPDDRVREGHLNEQGRSQ